MTKLHGFTINVGDRVWSTLDGWGKVSHIYDVEGAFYSFAAEFREGGRLITATGRIEVGGILSDHPVVFWRDFHPPNSVFRPPGVGFQIKMN